jgi:hypothetical protein
MMVGNNFSNLSGWDNYTKSLDYHDETKTWKRLNALILPASEVPLDEFWFTNFSLGVMDMPDASYPFPSPFRRDLKFREVFQKCVVAMQPTLIVALGGDVASYLKADYVGMGTHRTPEVRTREGYLVAATLHPAARRIPDERFKAEGKRIGELYRSFRAGQERSS